MMFGKAEKKLNHRSLAYMLSLTAVSLPLIVSGIALPTSAQSSGTSDSFSLPTEVPQGTKVRIDGSTSMAKLNEALARQFESQFPNTKVNLNYQGTDAALEALLNGEIDLAAIGRPLTDAEKAQGLVATPVTRDKISLIVGPENQFDESLTIEQFAKIFRGEITDWSEVGGSPGAIRLIDRPATSDTRRAFQNYPVFSNIPLESGANAVKLSEDNTEAVIEELGTDGIGYAIAGQVVDNPEVRVLSMHDVPPSNPSYPFSQPLLYVYKGTNPSPAAQAFLGYVRAPENQQTIEQAVVTDASAAATIPETVSPETAATAPQTPPTGSKPATSPEATTINPQTLPPTSSEPATSPETNATTPQTPPPTASEVAPSETTTTAPESPSAFVPNTTERTETETRGFPWWSWLLLIPILGGLLWWLLKGRGSPAGTTVAPVAAPIATRDSRIILTPHNCRDAYAYWEIPNQVKENLQKHGRRQLKLRLYDVTDIEMDSQTPHSVKEFDCHETEQDLHLPIEVDDRDYIAELGHISENGRWIEIARSEPVRVPACRPNKDLRPTEQGLVGATAVGAAASSLATDRRSRVEEDSNRVILVPRNSEDMYAYWEISEERQAQLREAGGRQMALRVYDTTGRETERESTPRMWQYDCDERARDLHVPIPESDREYVAELGYVTANEDWLKLASSTPVKVPSTIARDSVSEPSPDSNLKNFQIAEPANFEESVERTEFSRKKNPAPTASNLGANVTQATDEVVVDEVVADSYRKPGWSIDNQPHTTARTSPVLKRDCRIILVPRNSRDAYAYWEVSDDYKAALRERGGAKLMLRVHDVTNIDIDRQAPHNTQEYECDENQQDQHITIAASARDYLAELGYYTDEGEWLGIIRSFHVRVPGERPSS